MHKRFKKIKKNVKYTDKLTKQFYKFLVYNRKTFVYY